MMTASKGVPSLSGFLWVGGFIKSASPPGQQYNGNITDYRLSNNINIKPPPS
jgi:hypothetical protein